MTSADDVSAIPAALPATCASLATLPRELVIACLSHCWDPLDVVHFGATSRAWLAFVHDGEAIWRALTIRRGWTLERTTAESGTELGARFDPLAGCTGADELARAVAAQRTLDRPYEGVDSWRGFYARRWAAEQAWKHGRETLRAIDIGGRDAFRFKFDTETSSVVFSSFAHMLHLVRAGVPVGETIPAPHWSHVELSEGYLCFARSTRSIAILRRPTPAGPFELLHTPELDHNVRAYKARAPVIVVVGPEAQYTVIDLATGHPVQRGRVEIDVTEAQSIVYVDLDAKRLFIAFDNRVEIISRTDGRTMEVIGPMEDFRFEACHVDLRGRHLVAIVGRFGQHGGAVIVRDLTTGDTSILRLSQVPRELSVEVRGHRPHH